MIEWRILDIVQSPRCSTLRKWCTALSDTIFFINEQRVIICYRCRCHCHYIIIIIIIIIAINIIIIIIIMALLLHFRSPKYWTPSVFRSIEKPWLVTCRVGKKNVFQSLSSWSTILRSCFSTNLQGKQKRRLAFEAPEIPPKAFCKLQAIKFTTFEFYEGTNLIISNRP